MRLTVWQRLTTPVYIASPNLCNFTYCFICLALIAAFVLSVVAWCFCWQLIIEGREVGPYSRAADLMALGIPALLLTICFLLTLFRLVADFKSACKGLYRFRPGQKVELTYFPQRPGVVKALDLDYGYVTVSFSPTHWCYYNPWELRIIPEIVLNKNKLGNFPRKKV